MGSTCSRLGCGGRASRLSKSLIVSAIRLEDRWLSLGTSAVSSIYLVRNMFCDVVVGREFMFLGKWAYVSW